MKRTLTTFSCVLLLLGAARANSAENKYSKLATTPLVPAEETSEGEADEPVFVGDINAGSSGVSPASFDGDFVGDLDVADEVSGVVGDTSTEASDSPLAAPVPVPDGALYESSSLPMTSELQGNTYYGGSQHHTYSSGLSTRRINACEENWLRAETLLWFPESRNSPSLVTTGDALENQFGNPIDSGLAPGYRLDYGKYFKGGNFGIGARVWGLFGEEEDYRIASDDPAFNIQRPYFNTLLGINDALIVSGTQGLNTFTGAFDATSEFDIVASEAYGRILFGKAENFRVDLIGGYSFFAIDDELTINSLTVGGAIPGQERRFRDSFDAANRFHGGQLGFETQLNKGRWSMTSLTKVHLGNMNQRLVIAGGSVSDLPGPPPPVNYANGFFVQGQQGVYEQDEFSFVPEVNIKLGYQLRSNVHFTVGYSFLFWNTLALAGEQLDPRLDPTYFLDDTANPQFAGFQMRDSSLWIQGIDLGLTIDF